MHRRSITYGFAQRQSAQALVEFALILPLMLILVLGSLDIGRALVYGVAVQDGAHEAARLGATARTDTNTIITDVMVRQRLIDGSRPALDGCDATTLWGQTQACPWIFTIQLVNGDASISETAPTAKSDPQFPGSQIKVTAIGQVSMWAGFSTPWGWTLFPITARGQAAMMVQ